MTDAPPQPLAVRFAQIVALLLEAVADCGGRRLIAGPLTLQLQRRFGKMTRRFAALLAHLAQFGADAPRRACRRTQLPRASFPDDPPPVAAAGPAPPFVRPLRFPRRHGWLVGLSLGTTAAGAQLQHLLEDPEMKALLAASPRLVALLRPLRRMLAVLPPEARLPRRTAAAERPRQPRQRRWRPSRRCDLLFLLRMGKPLIET